VGLPRRRPAAIAALTLTLLLAAACERAAEPAPVAAAEEPDILPVFEAADALRREWQHVSIWGETDWTLANTDGEVVIEAVGRGTSSALARWIEIDTGLCPVVEWSWRVDALPAGSNLSVREREDVAASLMFVFGDPGSLGNPKPVPTIRYVWAGANNAVGEIVDSPFFPGTLRNIVVRSGRDALGRWVTERRNLREDYLRAFGEAPAEPVEAFALYTDNDHLKEPAVTRYRWARMRCTQPPEDPLLN
jgi:hypothetical protein